MRGSKSGNFRQLSTIRQLSGNYQLAGASANRNTLDGAHPGPLLRARVSLATTPSRQGETPRLQPPSLLAPLHNNISRMIQGGNSDAHLGLAPGSPASTGISKVPNLDL